MTVLPRPPWAVADDEVLAPDSAEFAPCDEAISRFAAKAGAKLGQATYTTSRQWGRIVRVQVAMLGSRGPRVTCWLQPNGELKLVADFFSGQDTPQRDDR